MNVRALRERRFMIWRNRKKSVTTQECT